MRTLVRSAPLRLPAPHLSRVAFRRLGWAIALLLVGIPLVYILVARVLLGGGRLARLLSKDPEHFRLEYTSASSVWLGRVHVEGLDVRVRDDLLEWELHIDHADATLSLLALAAHRLHTSRVMANGVTWRMRFRRDQAGLPPEKVARLPVIDGFPALPLLGVPPDTRQGGGHPLTIDLDGLDLHDVRDVWLDTFRLAGDLTIQSALLLKPADQVRLSPSHVEIHRGSLATGGDPIVTDIEGTVDARIDAAPLAEMKGLGALRYLSGHSSLAGNLGGLAFLRQVTSGAVSGSGGAGPFRGTLELESGVVMAGTSSHLEIPPAVVTVGRARIGARGTIDFAVAGSDSGATALATIGLDEVALFDRAGPKPSATSNGVTVHVSAESTDLATAPWPFAYEWNAPEAHVLDMRLLDDVMGGETAFKIERGKARIATSGKGNAERLEATAAVESDVAMRIDGADAAGRIDVKGGLKATFGAPSSFDLSGTVVELKGLSVHGATPHPEWYGRVKLESALVHPDPPQADLAFEVSAHDARPILSLYAAMTDVSAAARTALAIVPDPAIDAATHGLAGSARLHVSRDLLVLHALDVRGSSTHARGEMTKRGRSTVGGFLFEAGPIAVGVEMEGDKSKPVLVGATGWFAGLKPAALPAPISSK